MKMFKQMFGFVAVAGLVLALAPMASAQIFSEDFSSYAGSMNDTQYETGLDVAHSGNATGWSTSGAGTMHAVDLGGGDWAIVFWQDNVITLATGIAANDNGVQYTVEFDYGTAVYGDGINQPGQRTATGDGLLVEVLRGNDSVLASQSFLPGAWDDASNHNLDGGLTGTLAYVGDGTGVVRLRIGPDGTLNSGRFEGEIDNITVSVASAATPGTLIYGK